MIFSLCGSHRTGKTTLAKEFAETSGAKFLPISVARLQKEIGFNSAKQDYSFDERMKIQEYLIDRMDDIYEANYGVDAVSDRSPFDLMGYALIHAGPDITDKQSQRLLRYLDRCTEVANNHCIGNLLVQPGIKLVEDSKSATCAVGFVEHLNAVLFGILNSERHSVVPAFYIPRHITDLNVRVGVCKNALARSMIRNEENQRVFTWNKSNIDENFFSPSTCPQ